VIFCHVGSTLLFERCPCRMGVPPHDLLWQPFTICELRNISSGQIVRWPSISDSGVHFPSRTRPEGAKTTRTAVHHPRARKHRSCMTYEQLTQKHNVRQVCSARSCHLLYKTMRIPKTLGPSKPQPLRRIPLQPGPSPSPSRYYTKPDIHPIRPIPPKQSPSERSTIPPHMDDPGPSHTPKA